MITIIIAVAAVVVFLAVVILVLRRFEHRRVNPVHNDPTSPYAARDNYDPNGLVDAPNEYGGVGPRRRSWLRH